MNILDTLRVDSAGITFKKFHIQRTLEAFQSLKKEVPVERLMAIYDTVEKAYPNCCVRIVFKMDGTFTAETYKPEQLQEPVRLKLREKPADMASGFKWEDRSRWNELLKELPKGIDDWLLYNADDNACETCRFNLFFFDREKSIFLTPELDTGCINGVYRRHLLTKNAVARNIRRNQIQDYKIFVGNSVRGLLPAQII